MLNLKRSIRLTFVSMVLCIGGLFGQQGGPPADTPGTDHMIVVTPGATPNSLSFTYSGCTSECDTRPVRASSRGRRNTVSWRFTFSGERIVMAQVNFPGGTPFFQERTNRTRGAKKYYDDHSASVPGGAIGFATVQKPLKTLNWRSPEGLAEIEEGDEFKYDVVVITVNAEGQTTVYVADPIVIVRRSEDDGGA